MLSRADASNIDAKYYLSLASIVVLYYDYALTLEMEISQFWSPRQHNWGRAIFLLNRYVALFGHVPVIFEMFLHNPTDKICQVMQSYHQYLAMVIQIIVGVIMITRTYALWGSSRKILAFLLVLCVVVAAFSGWSLFAGKSASTISALYPGIIGCQLGLSSNQSRHMGAAWGGIVVLDATIFALTVYKSLKFGRTDHRSIVDVLLRDGAIYFAVMGTTTLGNVFTFIFGRPFSRGIVTTMMNIFSSVAATRLMLNIRRRDQKILMNESLSIPDNSAMIPSIRFASIFVESEPSSLPGRPGENDLEESRQGDLEMVLIGESARIDPGLS